MQASLEIWQSVAADSKLLSQVAEIDPRQVSAIAKIRQDYAPEQVAVAIELIEARRKLQVKFGDRAKTMVADIAGAEQASSLDVAAYKASRFAHAASNDGVADLCCGIGGDTLGLLEAGCAVHAIDHDPLRCWMAGHNTEGKSKVTCGDVEQFNPSGRLIHLDPARRSETTGQRRFRLEDYQPGPDVIERLTQAAAGAAVKLSPGVDLESLPWPGEIEFISEQGRLVQAVLWTGQLARQARAATLIEHKQTHQLQGTPAPLPLGAIEQYVFTVDSSIERAELLGNLAAELNVEAVHPKLGLLTSNQPVTSSWLTGFEVIEQLPWREKKVKQWLSAHDAGIVEVKTRGKAVDPDPVAAQLRGKGQTPYTVFIHRWDTKKIALITRRLER